VGRDAFNAGAGSTAWSLAPRGAPSNDASHSTRDAYALSVANGQDRFRDYVAMFFTNWRNPEYGFFQKVGLTVKNRAIGLVNGGCCGHHGQPGC
jgi:hypothetical protein